MGVDVGVGGGPEITGWLIFSSVLKTDKPTSELNGGVGVVVDVGIVGVGVGIAGVGGGILFGSTWIFIYYILYINFLS